MKGDGERWTGGAEKILMGALEDLLSRNVPRELSYWTQRTQGLISHAQKTYLRELHWMSEFMGNTN